MHTVRQWLQQLGLPQSVEIFERNAVDLKLLGELRDEDLERIDVPAPGHRKKLLKATAESNGGVAPTVTIRASRPLKGSIGAQAERCQLPVVFCDLLGLTPLATKLGLKELRAELFRYAVLGVRAPQSGSSSSERRSCWR
jgi:SAM (Sterile alpha motif) domain-containing protein